MNNSALIMMISAWGIILFFTVRFLIKALKSKQDKQAE